MEHATSIPVMKFRETDMVFEYDDAEISWYQSNFGGFFVRAQDLARLAGVPIKKARAIYEEATPAPLQTKYCSLETATVFLRALREVSGGESFKIWRLLREEFTEEYVESKFDTPIVPWLKGGAFYPALNVTMLHKLGGVRVIAGSGISMKLSREETHQIIPVEGLLTNDSQIQALIQGIVDHDDLMVPKAYRKIVAKAKKSRLVISEVKTLPSSKGVALRRDNAELEQEVKRLRFLLEVAHIDPDQNLDSGLEEIEAATLHSTEGRQDEQTRKACAVIKALINEHYPLLFVQAQILREWSHDFSLRTKDWDHKAFLSVADSGRILNLLSDIQSKCANLPADTTIHDIEQLVRQNLGRYKRDVYSMVCIARERHAKQLERMPRAA